MAKLIPVSILIASVIVPMLFAARPRPKKAVRQLQITFAALALLWALLNLYVYPLFVEPE
jgi:hypothetical protein